MSELQTKKKVEGATTKHGRRRELVRAIPDAFPTPLRPSLRCLAWTLAFIVPSLFYVGPLLLVAPPFLYLVSPKVALILLVFDLICLVYPNQEWPASRKIWQLWYELFDFHHNLILPPTAESLENDNLLICGMHPHGIIPMHAFLWAAFCDQYIPQRYGFGGAADAAMSLPILRQLLVWNSCGSVARKVIQKGLDNGKNLFLLPGGVAEIFLAHPGTHMIKAKRRGLMKVALQTGACLVPCYVFGGNDFHHHLATYKTRRSENDSQSASNNQTETNAVGLLQEKVSRTVQAGWTLFWGQYGLPVPYQVKCCMVLGDPLPSVPGTMGEERSGGKKTCRKIAEPSEEQIEELMTRYTEALVALFDQYKKQAGCPEAQLEIR